ncbi:MAG: NAD(P)-dependent oxidoreductase [Saprospiraceae bacterium]|nr:NAD(P)-dependent oxidoreductase [Saprospiraceae bacterium]
MKIGILRERKKVPESRVPLTPKQVAFLRTELDLDISVEASPTRCYSDAEYADLRIPVVEDMQDMDILIGVKEVPLDALIPEKTYMFFSHTIKKQAFNRELLAAIVRRRIRLIDYELLTNTNGQRLIAFGHFAGIVGTHNALWTWGKRSGDFQLPRMKDCRNYAQAKEKYAQVDIPPLRIVLTGTGRVGTGALLTLKDMGFRQVDPLDYLTQDYDNPIFTQLLPHHYNENIDGDPFDKSVFYNDPASFKSIFWPYAIQSDIMINGIYWVPEAPAFFTLEQMRHPDFSIQVIADISCDMAPIASIPSTIRATTIEDPVYGFDPFTTKETPPYQEASVDMMTIDNLPNELPRDASQAFGKQFITRIMGELMKRDGSDMLERATITEDGTLTPGFKYLQDWIQEKV